MASEIKIFETLVKEEILYSDTSVDVSEMRHLGDGFLRSFYYFRDVEPKIADLCYAAAQRFVKEVQYQVGSLGYRIPGSSASSRSLLNELADSGSGISRIIESLYSLKEFTSFDLGSTPVVLNGNLYFYLLSETDKLRTA